MRRARSGGAPSDRQPPRRRTGRDDGIGGDQVEGRQAVRELLAAGRRRVRTVWIAEAADPSEQLDDIEALAAKRHVPVETVSRGRLDSRARTESPQGVLALADPLDALPLDDLCRGVAATSKKAAQIPFLLVVAGVTDPRNLGALLRSAECAGVTGIVLPAHRAVKLTPTVTKAAVGAIEHLRFSVVGGIPMALRRMTELGIWTVGLAGESARSLYDLPLVEGPVALVVGGEEKGLADLVRKRCDEVVAIPVHGTLPALNVGVAGAVACFEVARRRSLHP